MSKLDGKVAIVTGAARVSDVPTRSGSRGWAPKSPSLTSSALV
jgi:hypothetical protein